MVPMKREYADGLVMLAELTVKQDKLADFFDYTACATPRREAIATANNS